MKICKVCGEEINEHIAYSEIAPEGDLLYVVKVNDKSPVELRTGDSLCTKCHKAATWYKKMEA